MEDNSTRYGVDDVYTVVMMTVILVVFLLVAGKVNGIVCEKLKCTKGIGGK